MRNAISVTLRRDNLLWLKGQAALRTEGNVSEMLNRLIAEARTSGTGAEISIRSVAGTIDLPDDESLTDADAYVRGMFDRSLSRPMPGRERPKRPSRRG